MMNILLLSLRRSRSLIIFFILIATLSERSSGAHSQYESCSVPRKCSNGPNISYPFFITGLQESYCGYPGFGLNCTRDGFPALQLPENEYIVENIFYNNQSLQVYDAAVSGINILYDNNGSLVMNGSYPNENSSCIPIIRNTTLPTPQFHFASRMTTLHYIENCTESLPSDITTSYSVACRILTGPKPLSIFAYNSDIWTALEYCTSNVAAPVEYGYSNDVQALRSGFVLNWINANGSSCSACQNSGGRCGSDAATSSFRCFCPNTTSSDRCYPDPIPDDPVPVPVPVPVRRKNRTKKRLIEGFAATLTIVCVLGACIFIIIRKCRSNRETENQSIELFLQKHENLAPKRYNYRKLKKITNSFRDHLGKGGYANVYKGKLEDERLVAVKILNESKGNGEDFINEVGSISRTSHVNIVSLLGFCCDGSKRALIYEFMPNGSLDKFIHNTASSIEEDQIGWEKLFEIAVGIARGLEYLHQGCNIRILHLDIKPHNILLDEEFNPKIADFGLSKLCLNRASIVSMVGARGTIGYIAPEVFCRNFGDVSYKSDVYSYGMMVLEMVGKTHNIVDPGVDGSTAAYFPQNIYRDLEMNVDNASLDGNYSENERESARRKLTIVGLWCIQTDPKSRPSMSRVVEMLEGKLESLQVPPKPQFSSTEALAVNTSTSESIYSSN